MTTTKLIITTLMGLALVGLAVLWIASGNADASDAPAPATELAIDIHRCDDLSGSYKRNCGLALNAELGMAVAIAKQNEVYDHDTANRQVKKSQAEHLPGMRAMQAELAVATIKVADSVGR